MKTIGIIGGLGPMATVYYMEWIVRMTAADCDQAHPRILLKSIPDIPDRTAYILGKSNDSPLPALLDAERELLQAGADFITIPCITAHYFYDTLQEQSDKPVFSMTGDTAGQIAKKGIRKVGILATTGTVASGVLEREFQKAGVETVVPAPADQELVMEIIYGQIKKGRQVDMAAFEQVSGKLLEMGAQKIILGCTELSLLEKEKPLRGEYVDMLKLLAQRAVRESGASLKKEWADIL